MGGAAIMPIVVGAVVGAVTGGPEGALRGGILGGLGTGFGEPVDGLGAGLGEAVEFGFPADVGSTIGGGVWNAAAGGAFDMGVGGVSEAMGLGEGSTSPISQLTPLTDEGGYWSGGANDLMGPANALDNFSGLAGLDNTGFQSSLSLEDVLSGTDPSIGQMAGTINQLDPTSQLMFEQGIPPDQINALGDVGGTTASRIGGALEYAGQYGPSGTGLLGEIAQGYKQLKDPLKLFGAYRQWKGAQDLQKMYEQQMQQMQGFPYQNYYGLASDFADPAKRYQMLQSNPSYIAAAAYAENAQKRRNARSGNLNSGYGDSLLASVLGQNAAAWEQQMFGQISGLTGMNQNNTSSQASLAGSMLPAINTANNQASQSIGGAIASNSGFLPEIFQGSL